MDAHAPIGLFDSGLGGLTVVREIQKQLPHEDIIYFGDLARLPYGIKSKEQITNCSRENTEFLLQFDIKALVIACNSSASAAYEYLTRKFEIPIVDVIRPAAQEAVLRTRNGRIGILGTRATISSGAYEKAIKENHIKAKVFSEACPLFVPLVEEGILNGEIAAQVVRRYLSKMRNSKVDTIILGCTHFPLLRGCIQEFFGEKVTLVDCAPPAVRSLSQVIDHHQMKQDQVKKGSFKVYVSDLPKSFLKVGARFLGRELKGVQKVTLQEQVTVKGQWTV